MNWIIRAGRVFGLHARRAALLLVICAVAGLGGVGAQDAPTDDPFDIDSLFGEADDTVDDGAADGEGDQTADGGQDAEATEGANDDEGADDDETAEDENDGDFGGVVDIAALTTSSTSVTGSVKATAGVGVGLNEWLGTKAAEGRSIGDLRTETVGYTMSTSVAVDGRPQPYLRYRASLSSSLNTTSLAMSTPAFNEVFIDYTLEDALFLRAGKYGMSWGRARLFASPGNLVSRVSSGAALRGSGTLGLGSLTAVVYTIPAWTALYEKQGDWRSFGSALLLEQTFGPVTIEIGGHDQHDENLALAGTLTLGLGDLTLAGEGRYVIDEDDPGAPGEDLNTFDGVGNFLWESPSRRWTFWGEYSYDKSRRDDEVGDDDVRRDGMHLVGLAMKTPAIWGDGDDWRPQLTWRHAVGDTSGQVILGTSGMVAPDLQLSFGMPVFYGTPGTYYRGIAETRVVEDDDTLTDEEADLLEISGQDVISVTFGLSISFSF